MFHQVVDELFVDTVSRRPRRRSSRHRVSIDRGATYCFRHQVHSLDQGLHRSFYRPGPAAFIGFVKWLRGEYPSLQLHIERVIAEEDLVATHAHLDLEPGNPDNAGRALADFFRLEDGKVVEHWDVIQEVPKTDANDNGMF